MKTARIRGLVSGENLGEETFESGLPIEDAADNRGSDRQWEIGSNHGFRTVDEIPVRT